MDVRRIVSTGMKLTIVMLVAFGVLAVAGGAGTAGGTTCEWEWQNPLPQGNLLDAVSSFDESHAWAVGYYGTIVSYDGTAWTCQDSGTSAWLHGVSALDATHVWAVGENGTILFYNGTSWSSQVSGSSAQLTAVSALDATHVWAVGETDTYDGTILFYDGDSWSEQASWTGGLDDVSALDATHVWAVGAGILFYDGDSWDLQASPPSNTIKGVSALDATHVWAVSEDPIPYDTDDGAVLFYDGNEWSVQASMTVSLDGVSALDATHVWAVGYRGTILYYDGTTWSEQRHGWASDELNGVSALDATHVWAVGRKGPTILFTSDYGANWVKHTSGSTAHLLGVHALDNTHAWAVGYAGTILFYDGVSWSSEDSGTTTAYLNGVSACDPDHAWAVGDSGVILFYDGTSWISQDSGTTSSIHGVSALDPTHAWAAADSGILFYDGTSWSNQLSGSFSGVSVLDSTHVWAVGSSGKIGFFNGTSWSYQDSGTTNQLNGVSALDSTHVWAVGHNDTILFYNGTSWSSRNTGATGSFYNVSALDAGNVWAVNGLQIMYYDGTSWSEQYKVTCAGISALDADHIWAAGLNGAILRGGAELTRNVIASVSGTGGAVDPGMQQVGPGENASIDLQPEAHYHTASITDNGAPQTVADPYVINNVTDNHDVVVTYTIDTFTLSTGQVGSGTVAKYPGQASYDYGTSVRLTATPDAGWHFVEWTGDLTGSTNPADLVMDSNKTVIANFAINNYTVAASADPLSGGTVNGAGSFDHGTTVDLTATPAAHWHFVNWTEDGTEVSTDAAYSFTATANRTLVANFAIDTNTIYTSAETGGSINPSGDVVVDYGADQPFDINPDPGWHVDDVLVDGISQGPIPDYTFQNVTEDHVIEATFTPNSHTWYLAEGSTDWGFDCYVSVINPNEEAVSVKLTYMTSTGPVTGPTVSMPAMSQATVFPSATLGAKDFSTKVECLGGQAISVDRTMYWTGAGAPCAEAHCATGVTAPATTWYMPEGSSNWGFECFLLIQNPNASSTQATVTWMIEGASPQTDVFSIAANSRATYNMGDWIGAADASIKVEADKQVICERAMYRNDRREGHDSGGTTTPAADYYLAEGCTGFGFTTYVLVQNPQPTPTEVTVTYQATAGPVTGPSFTMPANSRKTINVNDSTAIPGPDPSFSTRVHGSAPIIAERAMYWNGGADLGQVCHDSIGLSAPHTTWYLADGQSSEGRETWTLVQNPNDIPVTVEFIYLTPSGTGNVPRSETIPANSRRSFNMAAHSGITGRAAIMVQCTPAGRKIMVERAMYWNDRGTGTDTIGGYSD